MGADLNTIRPCRPSCLARPLPFSFMGHLADSSKYNVGDLVWIAGEQYAARVLDPTATAAYVVNPVLRHPHNANRTASRCLLRLQTHSTPPAIYHSWFRHVCSRGTANSRNDRSSFGWTCVRRPSTTSVMHSVLTGAPSLGNSCCAYNRAAAPFAAT